jgi:hypothetical protein
MTIPGFDAEVLVETLWILGVGSGEVGSPRVELGANPPVLGLAQTKAGEHQTADPEADERNAASYAARSRFESDWPSSRRSPSFEIGSAGIGG